MNSFLQPFVNRKTRGTFELWKWNNFVAKHLYQVGWGSEPAAHYEPYRTKSTYTNSYILRQTLFCSKRAGWIVVAAGSSSIVRVACLLTETPFLYSICRLAMTKLLPNICHSGKANHLQSQGKYTCQGYFRYCMYTKLWNRVWMANHWEQNGSRSIAIKIYYLGTMSRRRFLRSSYADYAILKIPCMVLTRGQPISE